jgi:hypothetical protein
MFCPGTLGPHYGRPGPHTGGSGSHSRGLVRTHGGPGPNLEARTVYTWVRHLPMGARLTGDVSEYVTFSGHVAAPDPPMWWGLRVCHFLWTRGGTGPTHVVGSGAVAGPE